MICLSSKPLLRDRAIVTHQLPPRRLERGDPAPDLVMTVMLGGLGNFFFVAVGVVVEECVPPLLGV